MMLSAILRIALDQKVEGSNPSSPANKVLWSDHAQGVAPQRQVAWQHPAVMPDPPAVRLVAWTEEDLPLLVGLNAPEMKEQLGGPETPEQVEARHRQYVA